MLNKMTTTHLYLIDLTTTVINATLSQRNHNTSLSPYNTDYWKPFDEAAAIISYALFVAIVIPNGYVIISLLTKYRSRSRLHFFILHLAYADFLVGAFNVLSDAIFSSLNGVWYGGDVFCRIYRFLKVLFLCASNNLLIGMSLDRFIAIKWPMKFVRIGSKLDKALVLGAWLISVATTIFYLPFTKGIGRVCKNNFPEAMIKPYFTMVAIIVYILPTIVIVVCYSGICFVVWQKWKKSFKLTECNDKRDTNAGLLPKAKIKSIKMTLVICLAFFICWTPYFVMTLSSIYNRGLVEPGWNMLIQMLYPLNSAANPIIFICFNTDIFCRCKEGVNHTTTTTDETETHPTTV